MEEQFHTQETTAPEETPTFEIECEYIPSVNFAMQQNDVPFLKKISIKNLTSIDQAGITLRVWTAPEVAQPREFHIESIPSEESVDLHDVNPRLLRDVLVKQEEAERGELFFEVRKDGVCQLKLNAPLMILAYNEWNGTSNLPEILAAFALPNHATIAKILISARDILKKQGKDPSLSGYQAQDPKDVWKIAAAIYYALSKFDLTYINPPASFERTGQKIRTPDQIIETRMGTCLDLSLLFASCLEQAGLNPLVLVHSNHAYAGVWLHDEVFKKPIVPYKTALTKRSELKELLVLETTALTASPRPSFSGAVDKGKRKLFESDDFAFALDIKMCREMGIRPLISRTTLSHDEEGQTSADNLDSPSFIDLSAPEMFDEHPHMTPETDQAPAHESSDQRLERWKRKLLDLTRRNKLLNFKDTKKVIPLLCPDLGSFEDALAANEAFTVLPEPKVMSADDPREAELHFERTGVDARQEFLHSQLEKRRLYTPLTEKELNRRFITISRATRLNLEETGANTLFLALGFLKWFEPSSDVENRAPILLIPMEVQRKSIQSGFRLKMLDDEARINVTLLQKLDSDYQITITGLDPLPTDHSGLDVPKIMATIRQAVKHKDRWDVIEETSLAILTFNKFLMWLDLEQNAGLLKQNPVVKHLIETPHEVFPAKGDTIAPHELDDAKKASETFCPLDADSSQLSAVFAAETGRSFILEGPPGTGKSQTITNLIAHCLCQGQRVLFVSEKMAALNVVHKRLKSVNLAPFCLELHSRKTNKQGFRKQLQEAMKVANLRTRSEWDQKTDQFETMRKELNYFVRILHQPRSFEKSAFWGIERLIKHKDVQDVSFSFGSADDVDSSRLQALYATVRQLQSAVDEIGSPAEHPLREIGCSTWKISLSDEIKKKSNDLRSTGNSLLDSAIQLLPHFQLGAEGWSVATLEAAFALSKSLHDTPGVTRELIRHPDWQEIKTDLLSLIKRGRDRDSFREVLRFDYTEILFELDLKELNAKMKERQHCNFIKRWFWGHQVKKALKTVLVDPNKKLNLDEVENRLKIALSVFNETKALSEATEVSALFGSKWKYGEADWDELERIVTWTENFRHVLTLIPDANLETELEIREAWIQLATDKRDLVAGDGPLGRLFSVFQSAYTEFFTALNGIEELLELNSDTAWDIRKQDNCIDYAIQTVSRFAGNLELLRSWCAYRHERGLAVVQDLLPLIGSLEEGVVPVDNLEDIFEKSFAKWWMDQLMEVEPLLSRFTGSQHQRKIREFQKLDVEIRNLTREIVFSRLAANLPRHSEEIAKVRSSEAGKLYRFTMGGRFTIRRVFKECPQALARLKPCVLMSPLSVAQFLGADFPKFDLVVFDEASQMPVWDAIGALARGNQVIIVGDSKQLPPTNFFEHGEEDDVPQDEEDIRDLESILDDCKASRLPCQSLLWHYRSRHESLITFSNRKYYHNELLTFPSAYNKTDKLGVSWREVPEGTYDAGGSRTNKEEAQRVVEEIIRRLQHPVLRNYSIGVVTFSTAQQDLIENLLEKARLEQSEIDVYFGDDVEEPVFVKNLETVQGDERDIILFSVCYGPTRDGKINMRFGPLNNKGGERRLNVAITRARRQLIVFSTLRSDQIDLARTKAVGARHLKSFLEYAARGEQALDAELAISGEAESESPFEEAVYEALVNRGWEIDKQVGCSGYRIDLAVKHPQFPGKYLAGIECDGANYHSSKCARDRDRLRAAVLSDLGWKLLRIWSTDWWLEPERQISKVEEALQHLLQQTPAETDEDWSAASNAEIKTEDQEENDSDDRVLTEETTLTQKVFHTPSTLPGQQFYQTTYLSKVRDNPEDLYLPMYSDTIVQYIGATLMNEAPIDVDLLTRNVCKNWGVSRISNRSRDRIRQLLDTSSTVIRQSGDREFIWRKNQDPETYSIFRVPQPDSDFSRIIQEICPEEIANAAFQVLSTHISMNIEDLFRATANVFGITRLGSNVVTYVDEGIGLLQKRGLCQIDDDVVTIANYS